MFLCTSQVQLNLYLLAATHCPRRKSNAVGSQEGAKLPHSQSSPFLLAFQLFSFPLPHWLKSGSGFGVILTPLHWAEVAEETG